MKLKRMAMVTVEKEYFGEECPRCLTPADDGVIVCTNCGYAVPMALVVPYDDPPWEYSDVLVTMLRGYKALSASRKSGRATSNRFSPSTISSR